MTAEQKAELSDPRWWATPDDPESLAQLMREHVQTPTGYYIEAEPNFELASKLLASEQETAPNTRGFDGREGRAIIGGDGRDNISNTAGVGRMIAASENGGSGAMYAQTRLYTAAHVVYNNAPSGYSVGGTVPVGWICRNGTVDTTPGANPCDGAGEPGDPRWRFQGLTSPTNIFTSNGMVNCGWNIVASNGHINMPATETSAWVWARHDYARVDFSCSVGDHTGWFGTAGFANASLPSSGVRAMGYPGRAWCPAGAKGTSTDCVTNTMTGQGIAQRDAAPTTWANLWRSPGSSVTAGSSEADHTLRFWQDWTAGQSGGPLGHYFINELGWEGWHIIGVVSNSASGASPVNRANRRTDTVRAFLFP